LRVGTGENVLIAGFILRGTGEKPVVVRGIGPSLTLPGRLFDPVLELFDSEGERIAANDDWQTDSNAGDVEASTLAPKDSKEPALFRRLPANETTLYTAVISGKAGATGIGIVEVYDLDLQSPIEVVNIATRGFVQRDDDVMIGGVIVTGTPPELVLRAIGPSLAVGDKLADPVLELFDDQGERLAINDNWKDDQQAAIEASGLAPQNDRESAIRIVLPAAGNYTAVVRGANGGIGVGVVEVYKLSP
jgi:hypothetical protein